MTPPGSPLANILTIAEEGKLDSVWSPVLRALGEETVVHIGSNAVLLARSGRAVPIDGTVAPITDEGSKITGAVFTFYDVTERRQLEQQLLHAQKMESVGRLAGGVAHDFNNVLTAILGYAEWGIKESPEGSSGHASLHGIRAAAQKAADLTGQLMAFSRSQVIAPTAIDPNDLVLSMDSLLRRLIGEDIELVTVPAGALGYVKVDPNKIEQVLVNLVVNARDAMPEGGKVTIETAGCVLDQDYASRHVGVAPGEYVVLSVSDTGVGMTDEVRSRIFEPFFTTKEVGKGTGMGLSTSYGIVKQNGGNILAYSEPGHGTTFKVYLPLDRSAASPAPAVDQLSEPPQGTETVLLAKMSRWSGIWPPCSCESRAMKFWRLRTGRTLCECLSSGRTRTSSCCSRTW